MRLLERLSAYSFNLYYVKGKDMILADYLSRHRINDEDLNELIPISFNSFDVVNFQRDTYGIQTRSQGGPVPKVHGSDKDIDPDYAPEHQHKSRKLRERKKSPPPAVPRLVDPPLAKTPRTQKVASKLLARSRRVLIQRRPPLPLTDKPNNAPDPAPLPPTHYRPPPLLGRPISLPSQVQEPELERFLRSHKQARLLPPPPDPLDDTGSEEEILAPVHKIPLDSDFVVPPPLSNQVDSSKLVHKFLPQQGEIDRLLKSINRKILRDTNLPGSLKDLRAAYLTSPHFRDIYLYLMQNKLPRDARVANKLQVEATNYLILDGLLFKLNPDSDRDVLCIPTSKVEVLLDYYHSSIFGNHTGITKCYKTISQRFYCPNLAEHLRAYITGCYICQLYKKGKTPDRPHQKRLNLNVLPALTKLSMDIKHMPLCYGYKYILVLLCEVSNFLVAIPLREARAENVLQAIQVEFIKNFGPPTHIICDLDPAFTSSLVEAFAQHFSIKIITVLVLQEVEEKPALLV